MPVLKHARKKLRQDKKRTLRNKRVREVYKDFVKKAKANPTTENLSVAFSRIDKAAKQNIIHENKAARLKASLTKGTNETKERKETPLRQGSAGQAKVEKKPAKKATVKKTTKKATKKAGK